jgi:hypothetical protein
MHRRIVRELEALPERTRYRAALAYHSWAAGDASRALAYDELAADDAMARLATNEAVVSYERAVSCTKPGEARRAEL